MATDKLQETETVVLEVGLQATKAVRLQRVGQTFILLDYWIEDTVIATDSNSPKIIQRNVAETLSRLCLETKKLNLVINDASTFNLVQKVPVSIEGRIRSHVEQRLLQAHKIDLAKYFWTVTPLATGMDDQQALTEALSNKLPVLVSGTRKENVEALHAAFEKEGCVIESTFFQVPALAKAFEFYGGKTFENQIVAILHFNHAAYGLGIVKNGGVVSFHEYPLKALPNPGNHMQIQQEIRTCLAAVESRYRSPARCVFISGDYAGTDLFINELKEQGCYARTWNLVRKLSLGLNQDKREKISADGAQLNSVIGAGVTVLEALRKHAAATEAPAGAELFSRFHMLVRPLALVACILIIAVVCLWNWNYLQAEKLKNEIAACAHQEAKFGLKDFPLTRINEQLDELELFAGSRHRWLPVFTELQKINVPGIEVSQIRATDMLVILKGNPFDQVANADRKRKTSGALTIEARNEGGLASLESFMEIVKTNQQVRPLLNKRKPVRLLNNIPFNVESGKKTDATLFTVEYLLEEKLF